MTQTTVAPTNESQAPSAPMGSILELSDVQVHFKVGGNFLLRRKPRVVKAVDGVTLTVNRGETVGLVGESGSGKTTLGRSILRLVPITGGEIVFEGQDLSKANGSRLRGVRRKMGLVFQDPYGALNPRMTAGSLVGEPLRIHHLTRGKAEYKERVSELLVTVGLHPTMAERYPHEFSGGQRQRLGVARAIAAQPDVVVLDEPVSALDVSIQAQIINLLEDLQAQFHVAYLFIAHDLSVVRHISDRVAVMYLGHVMEMGPSDSVYENPLHPYTKALVSAIPAPDPILERTRERIVLQGDIPSPANPPSGCVFRTRCPIATSECGEQIPQMREIAPRHTAACLKVA